MAFNTASLENMLCTHHVRLHALCMLQQIDMEEFLSVVRSTDDVNVPNCKGETGLHFLCDSQRSPFIVPAIRVLLANGADVNRKTADNKTALNLAVEDTINPLVIKLLLEAGADGEYYVGLFSNVWNAVMNMDCGALLYLTEHGVSVNATQSQQLLPLNEACSCVHPDCVTVLLGSGADVDAIDRSGHYGPRMPLLFAIDRQTQGLQDLHCVFFQFLSAGPFIPQCYVDLMRSMKRRSRKPERYEKVLHDVEAYIRTPLSLQYSCRRQIRKSLFSMKRHHSPMKTVKETGLPQELCNFVLFGYGEMVDKYI